MGAEVMPPRGRARQEPADYSGRNKQEVISSLTPDAGLFGTGVFGAAPELSAAVSTRPITPVQQQAFNSNLPQIGNALAGMNIPTAEERAGYPELAKQNAAKAAATKVQATAQAAKDKEVYDYLANVKPETGAELINRLISEDTGEGSAIAAGAKEAKDFWSTQDYDPNKYKVAPDATFEEKITGLNRTSDSIFQSIASGNVPKGAIGQYAGFAQLGENAMPSMKEMLSGVGGGSGGDMSSASPITQYMAQSSIPPFLKIPGSSSSAAAGLEGHDDVNRVYMNTGEDLSKKYPNMAGKGKWIVPQGGGTVGSYDIQFVHDAYDPRAGGAGLFNDYMMPVATAVMTYYNPLMGVATTGTKAAAGETLHLGDYATALMGGLKATKILEAPIKAVAATATTPAIAADAGRGLFEGVSYSQSVRGLNTAFAAAGGDITGAVVSQFGEQLTRKALGGSVDLLTGKVGADGAFLTDLKNNYNINSNDLIKGLVTSEKALLAGASLQEAVLKGVGKYVVEGGSLSLGTGGIQTPEILKKLEDVVRTVGSQIDDTILQPVKQTLPVIIDAAEKVGKPIERGLRAVNNAVVKPVVETAIDAGSAVNRGVVKPVVEAGSAINRGVVKPVVGVVGDAAKATGNVIQAVTEPVIDVVDDVLDSTYDAVNQLDNFIDDIDLPSINLPNFNLPNFNLPNFNFGGGGGGGGNSGLNISGGQPVQRASLMAENELDEIDLGFELEELERAKQFEPLEYNPRGMQAI